MKKLTIYALVLVSVLVLFQVGGVAEPWQEIRISTPPPINNEKTVKWEKEFSAPPDKWIHHMEFVLEGNGIGNSKKGKRSKNARRGSAEATCTVEHEETGEVIFEETLKVEGKGDKASEGIKFYKKGTYEATLEFDEVDNGYKAEAKVWEGS